jgi:hypothetical protein
MMLKNPSSSSVKIFSETFLASKLIPQALFTLFVHFPEGAEESANFPGSLFDARKCGKQLK